MNMVEPASTPDQKRLRKEKKSDKKKKSSSKKRKSLEPKELISKEASPVPVLEASEQPPVEKKPKREGPNRDVRPLSSAGITTTIVAPDPDPNVDPLVVSFPGGVPASILDDGGNHDSSQDKPTFQWMPLKASSVRGKQVVGLDATCAYTAETAGRGHDGRLTKLVVGIYDSQKNQLTLQPVAEKGTVFSLAQQVSKYDEGTNNMDATTAHMTPMERRRVLFESFGSSKKQRSLKSQEANVVSVDSVVGAGSVMMDAMGRQGNQISESNRKAMEEASKGNKMDAIARAYEEARRMFLPPFDATADAPHKVYDAIELAGDDAWAQVTRVVDAVTKQTDSDWKEALVSKGHWSPSVKGVLEGISLSKKSAKFQIKIAVLLNHLIKFHEKTSKSQVSGTVEEVASFMHLPNDVCARFLELFASSLPGHRPGFGMSRQQRDKRIISILILYVLAHGRDMKVGSINGIVKELRIELKEAANILREAGFTIKKKSAAGVSIMSVSLSTPLIFPAPKTAGRK